MKTIRIDRKKWRRGAAKFEHEGRTFLWNSETKRGCCLGHVIHQVKRCSWASLASLFTPGQVYTKKSILTNVNRDKFDRNNEFSREAMRINDNSLIDEEHRELELTGLFKKNGLNLEFYG